MTLQHFVLPILECCSPVWSLANDCHLQPLERQIRCVTSLNVPPFVRSTSGGYLVHTVCSKKSIATRSMHCLYGELPSLRKELDTLGRLSWLTVISYARATLDKQSCVITCTLFKMNSTCMRLCDLNFSCLSTSSCQNKRRYLNPIWPTVFTFRVFKLSFCEFMTMESFRVHKST